MKKILVTGSNGQLGQCLQDISVDYTLDYHFIFADRLLLDITDATKVSECFNQHQPDYCINAAAYTAVDLAEKETDIAFEINANGVANLAESCKLHDTILIHISTDYVFDGESNISYSEENFTHPQSQYGASKLAGENLALEINPQTIVIRTSWLYSEYGNNFVKTMLNLFQQKEMLGIVNDQYGQPTYAKDLANAIMEVIDFPKKTYGVFHYSNSPETTWFHFAEKIKQITQSTIVLKPITTAEFPTAAKRPMRSTLDISKIESAYHLQIMRWENSLAECLASIIRKKNEAK